MAKRYVIRAVTQFSAAHILRGYAGACERLHGHNFKVEVEVEASALDEIGMGIDFTALQKRTEEITSELDHRFLNEVPPFTEVNPTAENIAAYVFSRLSRDLPSLAQGPDAAARVRLRAVTVAENDQSSVTYIEDPADGWG